MGDFYGNKSIIKDQKYWWCFDANNRSVLMPKYHIEDGHGSDLDCDNYYLQD